MTCLGIKGLNIFIFPTLVAELVDKFHQIISLVIFTISSSFPFKFLTNLLLD